jgi:EmrB/QacA subfamily drug resistance transporter
MNQPAAAAIAASVDTRRANVTLAIAGLAAMATYLDTTILFIAFPDIARSFGDSPVSTLSWVLNAYTIMFAALLVPAGKFADRLGHRRTFLLGSITFTVASMACGLAPNVEWLIAGRIAQGAGAAILVPASLALVMAAFPHEKIPQVVAIWGAIGALSAALGPSLGGAVVELLGWRWAFFLNLPVGLVTLVTGVRYLQESRDPSVRIPSLLGVALIALAAGLVSYALVESDRVGWASTQTMAVLATGLMLLAAFVVHQRWTDSPTLDLELFALRNFRWGNLAIFSYSIAFLAMFFGLILFLVNVWGWSILKAGFAVAPGPALIAILAPRLGKLAARVGQRPLLMWGGMLATSAALYRLAFLSAEVNYLGHFVVPLAMDAVAAALIFPQATSVAAQALPANRRGVGGAVIQAVRQFGGTLGVALTIAFVGAATVSGDMLARYDRIWWLLVVCATMTSLLAMPLRTARADRDR